MNVLVACEESQEVCKRFREKGHVAFSCDIQECSGGHPEWHILQDVTSVINGRCAFKLQTGEIRINPQKWDMIIAFPPCTYLTVTGNRWLNIDRYGEKAIQRHFDRADGINFFMLFAKADCEKVAIENPIGCMSTVWRKPDQIIQPYMFGHPTQKSTCLWLKGLPLLHPTNLVEVDTNDIYIVTLQPTVELNTIHD